MHVIAQTNGHIAQHEINDIISVAARVSATEMKSHLRVLVIISVALVGIAASLWIQKSWSQKRHYSAPFIELRFYAAADSTEPFYTLYLADATSAEDVRTVDRGLSVKRRNALVEVFGQGSLQYRKNAILCGPSIVSIDGRQLPPTSSQAVIKRDGQVVVGAFLRNYD